MYHVGECMGLQTTGAVQQHPCRVVRSPARKAFSPAGTGSCPSASRRAQKSKRHAHTWTHMRMRTHEHIHAPIAVFGSLVRRFVCELGPHLCCPPLVILAGQLDLVVIFISICLCQRWFSSACIYGMRLQWHTTYTPWFASSAVHVCVKGGLHGRPAYNVH